jgi:hypothetical protein
MFDRSFALHREFHRWKFRFDQLRLATGVGIRKESPEIQGGKDEKNLSISTILFRPESLGFSLPLWAGLRSLIANVTFFGSGWADL